MLFAGDQGALRLWIAVHVGVDRQAWRTLAVVLASIAATSVESNLHAQLRASGIDPARADVVPVPYFGESPDQVAIDAGHLVVMAFQHDDPGVLGVVDAVDSRDALQEVCGAIAVFATQALQAEAAFIAAHGGVGGA